MTDETGAQAVAAAIAKRLARKKDCALWGLQPDERSLFLFAFWQSCRDMPPLNERAFNDVAARWLADMGGVVRTDVAEFRRTLVDTGYVERDLAGRAYKAAQSRGDEDAAFGEGSCTALLTAARADEQADREARRKARDG